MSPGGPEGCQSLPYRIEYSPDAVGHLRALAPRHQAIILDAIDRHLIHEPFREARNRKPMRPNPVAPWELRVGEFRVYYDGAEGMSEPIVCILAVGMKRRNRIFIGGEEIML